MTIRFLLREILAERGISERQFAQENGIREGTLYDICNNEIKRVPVDVIEKISTALDIEPGEWIKRK
ncbi:helix-turn-helix domain-containing protein [Brevibacillus borstelensis]|uniref:helix-turn-helix domain-containing protein n=1 Tax=Brevibacillus borstelensis TaxID=45462 RepID=UPI000468484C|nr:helix-turn-helix transcriptional regulator [Brevibacillus borstelensis]MCC0566536.1 helix-turn-helix transcriptional regulator [Brevibacillus borstelensis]MCM3473068.1 helix-turn-helix transcriptional regulator [Brevibacillus borstelensis]MCM3561694.1 helix-turn-helix transcriptional regulator [Brevibacillus borstelensis]MED1852996.1 helix-turn-helix transcriptional regulator [Brevibacillus borstelensis]